jgi:hypothetical protein
MTAYTRGLGPQAQVSVAVDTGKHAPVVADGGYLAGQEVTFTIPNNANGSAVALADLGKPYTFILVRCEDTDGIDTSVTMTATVKYAGTDTAVDLWEQNGVQKWTSGVLPATASGTFGFVLIHALGFRHIGFTLSKVTTAPVVFKLRGLDGVLS